MFPSISRFIATVKLVIESGASETMNKLQRERIFDFLTSGAIIESFKKSSTCYMTSCNVFKAIAQHALITAVSNKPLTTQLAVMSASSAVG